MNFENAIKNCEYETFRKMFFESALPNLDAVAIERDYSAVSIKYSELLTNIVYLGSYLYSEKLKGSKVALIGNADENWVYVFLSCLCSNIIVSPIDEKLNEDDIVRRIDLIGADLLFIKKGCLSEPFENKLKSSYNCRYTEEVPSLIEVGRKLFEDGYSEWTEDTIHTESDSLILFTSGTGGETKGAVLSQCSVCVERLVKMDLTGKGTVSLVILPLFHLGGMDDMLGTLLVGGKVYLSAGFSQIIKEFMYVKPECCVVVPSQAVFLHELVKDKPATQGREMLGGKLKCIRSCGAMLPDAFVDGFEALGISLTSDYGLTETATIISKAVRTGDRLWSKRGSVGKIVDFYDITLEDPDEKGAGEVAVSGKTIFKGYYNNPEATKKVLKDGRLYTGDIGYLDDDGFLFLVGRKKNLIILSSGENVIPEELEAGLMRIEAIQECMVYADGDVIAADIYLKEDRQEAVREEIRKMNHSNPSYKWISKICFTDEPLPKTGSGKIKRK